MKVSFDTKYQIDPQRGGDFQLWTLADDPSNNKETLVLIFGFYGATQKAIAKYCDIYLAMGLNVLYIPSRLVQFALPSHAIKLGHNLIGYLDNEASCYGSYIAHTLSMGSFNFVVFNFDVLSAQPEKYKHIKDKIKAVVYDSIAYGSVEHMREGIGKGMVRNRLLQRLIPAMMALYFFIMHNYTVKLFERWLDLCRTKPLEVPTLFFFCENDPMSDYKHIQEMISDFRKMGTFLVLEKCWFKSRHSLHLMIHTSEYMEYLNRLLSSVPELSELDQEIAKSKL